MIDITYSNKPYESEYPVGVLYCTAYTLLTPANIKVASIRLKSFFFIL